MARKATASPLTWRSHRLSSSLSPVLALSLLQREHFADVGRQLSATLFADLPTSRRREVTSAIAHYVAGVLDRDAMVEIVESLCESAQLEPGARVKTLRGSLSGIILRVRKDGKVVWQPDGTKSELIALPESLIRLQEKN